MSLMEQHQSIKVQCAVRGIEPVCAEKLDTDVRAKKSAEFKRLKVTTSEEFSKPSCWENFSNIFKPGKNNKAS